LGFSPLQPPSHGVKWRYTSPYRRILLGKGVRDMSNFKLIVSLILAASIVLFTVQNAGIVELRFMFWKVSASRSVMILGVLAVGIVLGWFLRSLASHKPGRSGADTEKSSP